MIKSLSTTYTSVSLMTWSKIFSFFSCYATLNILIVLISSYFHYFIKKNVSSLYWLIPNTMYYIYPRRNNIQSDPVKDFDDPNLRFIINFNISFQSFSIRKSHFFHSFFFFWQIMQYFVKAFASLTSEKTFAPRYMNYKNHCRNFWSDISLMKYVITRTSFYLKQKINWKNFARFLSMTGHFKSTFNKYCRRSSDFCLLMTDHFFFNWVPYDTCIKLKNVSITIIVRT